MEILVEVLAKLDPDVGDPCPLVVDSSVTLFANGLETVHADEELALLDFAFVALLSVFLHLIYSLFLLGYSYVISYFILI